MSYRWGRTDMNNSLDHNGEDTLITVLNMDGKVLTPCQPHRAWREVERSRAVWIDEETIKLLYNPFLFRDYRKKALKRDRFTCIWCGYPANTVDHLIPASKGGSDKPSNLAASCGECNTKRGNRSAFLYLKEKWRYVPNPIKACWRIVIANLTNK